MQTFKQKKIALAVGASLLAMAGVAQAATAPPTLRTTKPALISSGGSTLTTTTARKLYNGQGHTGTLDVTLNFTVPSGTLTNANGLDVEQISAGADGFIVNGNAYTAAGGANVTPATTTDDVSVYTVNGTTLTTLSVANLGFTANVGGATGSAGFPATTTASALIRLDSGAAPRAFRMSAAGALEWIADIATAATAANWLPVKLSLNLPTTAANGISAHERLAPAAATTVLGNANETLVTVTAFTGAATNTTSAAGAPAAMVAVAGQDMFSTVKPTPIVSTRATGGLVDGITYDTLTPLLAFATANVMATSVDITGTDTSCPNQGVAVPVVVGTVASSAAPGAVAATGVANYPITITTPATTVDWRSDNGATVAAAVDGAAYNVKCFGTGIATTVGTAAPFTMATPAAMTYSLVFDAAGAQASLAAALSTATLLDGAAPVVTSIGFSTPNATTGATDLSITFSENMVDLNLGGTAAATAANIREVLENISVGTAGANGATTLAALELNSGLTPSFLTATGLSADKLATDKLTISNVQAADIATLAGALWTGKSLTVATGIALQEPNDNGYTAGVPALDSSGALVGANGELLAGGIGSKTAVVEGASGTVASITAAAITVAWGTDTTAVGHATTTSPISVDTITVTFAAGKEVKLAPAGTVFGTNAATAAVKTTADLAANLVIDVYGTNGFAIQVHPTTVSGTAATATGGNTLTITLPTNLIYSKLAAAGSHLKAMYVGYVSGGSTSSNNVLVAVTGSTLTAPVTVAAGVLQPAGAGTSAELTNAGAEPVTLPLVFTAAATGSQSTLLTQDIQSNVVGASTGSIVYAYLAYWVDLPKITKTLVGSDIVSGKITNPSDKVATDLAIEFADGSGNLVATKIVAELNKVAPAVVLKAGVNDAVAAVTAKPVPVYVKLIRSNDAVANTKGNNVANTTPSTSGQAQNYLEARAIMADTYANAQAAGGAEHSGANLVDPIYEVLLDPTTGKITGRLTGDMTYKTGTTTTTARGLRFLDANGMDSSSAVLQGSTLVGDKSATNLALPGTANMNLLMGIDPASTDIGALQALNPFVLLVHSDSTGRYTMLTSADPTAGNYMPFAPDLLNLTTGTGGIAVRATTPLSVTDVKAFDLPVSNNWALYGIGKPATRTPVPAVAADKAFPRRFVGLNTVTGLPVSLWTSDAGAAVGDMAIAMAGNKVGVATELLTDAGGLTGPTLTNITDASYVKNAVGLAWANENGATDGASAKLDKFYVAQATGPFAPAVALTAPALAAGWSLVTVPGTAGAAVTTLGTVVDAVIKVGAQVGMTASSTPLTAQPTGSGAGTGQFTWFAVDGAMPSLTAGEAVFVHAKAAGNL